MLRASVVGFAALGIVLLGNSANAAVTLSFNDGSDVTNPTFTPSDNYFSINASGRGLLKGTYNLPFMISGFPSSGSSDEFMLSLSAGADVGFSITGPGTSITVPPVTNSIDDTVSLSDGTYDLKITTTAKSNNFDGSVSVSSVSAVPEVSTWAMMVLGFAGLGFVSTRKKRSPVGFVPA